jgi:hypothetical protein
MDLIVSMLTLALIWLTTFPPLKEVTGLILEIARMQIVSSCSHPVIMKSQQ